MVRRPIINIVDFICRHDSIFESQSLRVQRFVSLLVALVYLVKVNLLENGALREAEYQLCPQSDELHGMASHLQYDWRLYL